MLARTEPLLLQKSHEMAYILVQELPQDPNLAPDPPAVE